MLTRDDLTSLKTKENYLDAARKRRPGSTGDGGVTGSGETLRGTISTNTSYTGGYEGEGSGETQSVYGGDGSKEGGEGNPIGFSEQFRRNSFKPSRRDSSVYKPQQPASKSIWSSVKDTAKQYSTVLKAEPKKPKSQSAPKKGESRKLTDSEAIKMRPKLIEFIEWQSEHLDDFISATTKGHMPVEVWSTLDRDDAEIIVDFLISQAKINDEAAVAVRFASTMMDKIKLGLVVGPRVYKTLMIYVQRGFSIGPIFQRRY